MKNYLNEKTWHELFEWGIFIKGIDGLIETIAGFSLLLVSKIALNNIFIFLAKGELVEDPKDFFVTYISAYLQHLSVDTKIFVALYILIHGLVKIFLAVMLYKEKLWVYPIAIWFEMLFIAYQTYRFIYNHSLLLAVFIIFDMLFLLIIWHEYRNKINLKTVG